MRSLSLRKSLLFSLAFLLLPLGGAAEAQISCDSYVGCMVCAATVGGTDSRPRCKYEDKSGGCDCTISVEGRTASCETTGSCTYLGWGGGDPPAV